MVVKREYSESGSDFADEDEDIKPVITPTKKSRSTPSKTKTQSPSSSSKSAKSQSDSGSSSKKTELDNSAKRTIAEEIINVGIKGINVDSLAKATGLTVQQVRSQVAGGGRANLRKQLMDLAMAL